MFRIVITFFLFLCLSLPVQAKDVIGLMLPASGRFLPIAKKLKEGAELAAKKLNDAGYEIEIKTVDDHCDPEKVKVTAELLKFVEAKIVVGSVCFKTAAETAVLLNSAKKSAPPIPVIAVNTRNPLLKRKRNIDGLPLYSLSAAPDAEAQAVISQILPKFEGKPFAVLDDGSVYGRSLADSIIIQGELAGFKPIITANFRPYQTSQVASLKRLHRTGTEAVFLAAGAEDVAVIAKNIKTLDYDWVVASGEAANLLPYIPEPSDVDAGLLSVGEIIPKNEILDANALLGHALIEIAAEALKRKELDLTKDSFQTVLGELSFNGEGRAEPFSLGLLRWDGSAFQSVEGK